MILSTLSSSAEIDQYAASLPAFDKVSITLYWLPFSVLTPTTDIQPASSLLSKYGSPASNEAFWFALFPAAHINNPPLFYTASL